MQMIVRTKILKLCGKDPSLTSSHYTPQGVLSAKIKDKPFNNSQGENIQQFIVSMLMHVAANYLLPTYSTVIVMVDNMLVEYC